MGRSSFKSTAGIAVVALLATGIAPLVWVQSAAAAVFPVTTTADGGPGSLRQAVSDADASPTGGVVTMPSGTYTLSDCATGAIVVTSHAVEIDGAGSVLTQTCSGKGSLAASAGGSLEIRHLTFDGTTLSPEPVISSSGSSPLHLTDVVVDGATLVDTPAVRSAGALHMTGGTVRDVSSAGTTSAGVVAGDGTVVTGATFSGNEATADDFDGSGGLDVSGRATIADSTFTDNTTAGFGGGLSVDGDADITSTVFSGNTSSRFSAGGFIVRGSLHAADLQVLGNQTPNGFGGGFTVVGDATVERSDISDNSGAGSGGFTIGRNLTLTDSTVTGNDVTNGFGGGNTDGSATIIRSHIDGNSADGQVGGIYGRENLVVEDSTIDDNDGGFVIGGADAGVHMRIERSSVVDNRADDNAGLNVNNGDAEIINSTVARNISRTDASYVGGGIAASEVRLSFATVVDNDARGAANIGARTLIAFASVVGGAPDGKPNCHFMETVTSLGWNVEVGDDTCGFGAGTGDLVDAGDPHLGPLGPNGSTTLSRVPETGSYLLDAVPASDPTCSGLDQRGVTRPQGSGCDIGAVEVEVVPIEPTTTTTASSSAPPATPVATEPKLTG